MSCRSLDSCAPLRMSLDATSDRAGRLAAMRATQPAVEEAGHSLTSARAAAEGAVKSHVFVRLTPRSLSHAPGLHPHLPLTARARRVAATGARDRRLRAHTRGGPAGAGCGPRMGSHA